jgi:hypothetical protein
LGDRSSDFHQLFQFIPHHSGFLLNSSTSNREPPSSELHCSTSKPEASTSRPHLPSKKPEGSASELGVFGSEQQLLRSEGDRPSSELQGSRFRGRSPFSDKTGSEKTIYTKPRQLDKAMQIEIQRKIAVKIKALPWFLQREK